MREAATEIVSLFLFFCFCRESKRYAASFNQMILKNTYNSHHTENNGGPNEKEHPSSDFQARLMAPWFFYTRATRAAARF
jgi:hypothetical protein